MLREMKIRGEIITKHFIRKNRTLNLFLIVKPLFIYLFICDLKSPFLHITNLKK